MAAQHLSTAHYRSGFIMEAAFQFDPSMTMDQAEDQAHAANISVAFRQHARIWTNTEFQDYLVPLKERQKVQETELYQLPHQGVLVRYDILQYADALPVQEMLSGADVPLLLMIDDDRGLQHAFQAAFVQESSGRKAEIAVVSFDKGTTNYMRNYTVAGDKPSCQGCQVADRPDPPTLRRGLCPAG
ncbi:hypothetical protein [Palleronia abyssalis]|uniref:Uncharacterized protein n=1 Tax=Palleronia abyssalis TaxID=1501240 RepID=A0A2R8BXC6_9RHOB|nr:hypothetical protein [Palleronia abyssalis]SPJ24811.1 hypothetical protein PAA8504_02650 [Palleronia abyssalis]